MGALWWNELNLSRRCTDDFRGERDIGMRSLEMYIGLVGKERGERKQDFLGRRHSASKRMNMKRHAVLKTE